MKVILKKKIKNLGNKKNIIKVSSGYGRNFLIPKKIAIIANKKNIKNIKNSSIISSIKK